MIYADKSSNPAQIFVPVNGTMITGAGAQLVCRSTSDMTTETLVIDVTAFTGGGLKGYLLAGSVTIPKGMALGEWEYKLTVPDGLERVTISSGILVGGDGPQSVIEYDQTIEYRQYGE